VPAGDYKLTARSIDSDGNQIVSDPVLIHVFAEPPPPTEAYVKILSPTSGTIFPGPQDRIRLGIQGQDPNGVFQSIEVFANDIKLGDAVFCCPECDCIAPGPGKPSYFTFDWHNVAAGTYDIVALGKSTSGLELKSDTLHIVVHGGDQEPPVVNVVTK